ncbi:hypothetical protein Tco_0602284 [Tanacetum coccineum]
METEVESMVTVPIQQVSSSVPLLILQSSISHLLNQYLLPVKNHSLQLSPPTSALQQSSSVLEMVKSRLLFNMFRVVLLQEPVVSTVHLINEKLISRFTFLLVHSQTTQEEQSHVIPTCVEEDDHGIETVSTGLQNTTEALLCYFDASPPLQRERKSYKDALTNSCWIDAMKSWQNTSPNLRTDKLEFSHEKRVKEFKIKRLNPGLNTCFWTKKDVTRSKEFIKAIKRRLKTRRIYQNLECFVGGRVRDIDYRLLQRTERYLGFNPLVHSFCALSTLRRSGLRTASAAAKPCQGDSLEFYLITGRIPTVAAAGQRHVNSQPHAHTSYS